MIVVSDTTPLNYLLLINLIDVIPGLFDRVYVPTTVLRELSAKGAPDIVRAWAQALPNWVEIADPQSRLPSTVRLDEGEADAISLAKERSIRDILIDEYQGRRVVLAEGLFALPTLAVLERAAERNLIDLPTAIDALRATSYRVRPDLLAAVLRRNSERKRSGH